jgi:hypothetical protein
MSKAKLICIEGYWHATREPLECRCLVMPRDLTDSMRDLVLDSLIDKDNLFYVFTEGDRIMGDHPSFTVTFINPIDELEVPAVC